MVKIIYNNITKKNIKHLLHFCSPDWESNSEFSTTEVSDAISMQTQAFKIILNIKIRYMNSEI